MSEREPRTPKTSTVRTGWMKGHPYPLTTDVYERGAEFDRWLDGVKAEAAREKHDDTTATDVPEEIQERAAIALYEQRQHPNWRAPSWEEIDPEGQDAFREQALAVLEEVYGEIQSIALRGAAASPIPRDALANGTRKWLRKRADQAKYRERTN